VRMMHPFYLPSRLPPYFKRSHFDEYIADFTLFKKLPGSSSTFKPPRVCDDPDQRTFSGKDSQLKLQELSLSLLPSHFTGLPVRQMVSGPESIWGIVTQLLSQGKKLSQPVPAEAVNHITSNSLMVQSWNANYASSMGFKLALNMFASQSHGEFRSTRLGHKPRPRFSKRGNFYLGVFQRKLSDREIPRSVDYRGTGADGIVKDQASCGSCWAFASTGTMTGTYWVATGESLSLSEQHIVDCAWDFDVNGCWGGEGESAMEMIVSAGGATME
jgi:hypothetical protein